MAELLPNEQLIRVGSLSPLNPSLNIAPPSVVAAFAAKAQLMSTGLAVPVVEPSWDNAPPK
jgi:hypothetical protein